MAGDIQDKDAAVAEFQADEEKVKELVETFDPEMRFRNLKGMAAKLALVMCLILSIFHIHTAGFGVLQEWLHRCYHAAFVIALVFLVYPTRKVPVKNRSLTIFYEVVFSLISGVILAFGLQDILDLSPGYTALTFFYGFFLAFAMKTRDLWKPETTNLLDLAASVSSLGALAYTGITLTQNWPAFVGDSDWKFVLWSYVFYAALIIPLVFMFWSSVRVLTGQKEFRLDPQKIPYFEMTLAVLAFGFSTYIVFDFDQFVFRAGWPSVRDLVIGNFAILLVLEATRRSIGLPLAILGLLALASCYLGPYFIEIPGLSFFAHRGYSPSRIIDHMYLGTEGIYGIPLGVVATFVFHFVLFGIFIMKTGLGKFFIDMAMALAGWSAGGPAKVSVVASGMLGCISGSSVANTVTTGAFTIPMMKKLGYRREFAGAVEAAASTGGQFMPPIMGAVAFIMAEFLGISYLTVATCAIVPAVCHFFAVGWMVHLEAKKNGLTGIPRDRLPRVSRLIREDGVLVLPLMIIVWLLLRGFTPFLAAFWGILSSVAYAQSGPRNRSFFIAFNATVPMILFQWNPFHGPLLWAGIWAVLVLIGLVWSRREASFIYWIWGVLAIALLVVLLGHGMAADLAAFWTTMFIIVTGLILRQGRVQLPQVIECLEWGTKNALAIGAACAAVGFIIGTATLTGLGLKFANATIYLAEVAARYFSLLDFLNLLHIDQTTLFFTLIFTAIASLILGMGLPTTPNFIIVSIIAAPALMEFGIPPLVSFMFVFYFGILADLTPPVAVAAYAASGISQGDPFLTGCRSFSLALAVVYVPFAFVFSPILVLFPWILETPRSAFPFMDFFFLLISILLGIIALGALIIGYLADRTTKLERLLIFLALLGLWWHSLGSSLVGFLLLVGVYVTQSVRKQRHGRGDVENGTKSMTQGHSF